MRRGLSLLGAGLIFLAGAWLFKEHVRPSGSSPVIGPGSVSYERQTIQQALRSKQVEGSVFFFGNSIMVGFATSLIGPNTENFGINSDTIDGLTERLPHFNLEKQRAVVIEVGINDLARGGVTAIRYQRMLERIPASIPVLAIAITPSKESAGKTQGANAEVRKACDARPQCRFIDITDKIAKGDALAPEYDAGDGVHLNPSAYAILRSAIIASL